MTQLLEGPPGAGSGDRAAAPGPGGAAPETASDAAPDAAPETAPDATLERDVDATADAPHGDPALREIAAEAGIGRVRLVAWRDLDHPEAGGSELHAHRIASRWAASGLAVELRTSSVPGALRVVERSGYRAVRRSGRYAVFARVGIEGLARRAAAGEALVEIWNGMPFWSPAWYRGPRVVFLHHVHAEMWRMVLPPWLARAGEATERRLAPPLYRRTRVVTLSESSKAEIVGMLGLDPDRVTVAPPGVDARFVPGGDRSRDPLVVAVGRLVPVKRFDLLLRVLAGVREAHPRLRAVVAGEGYDRPRLEAVRDSLGAADWIELPGRVPDGTVVDLYRRAWVVASTSVREGWGMTLTEAGACATPAVATDIAGHRDSVAHGRTGLLARSEEELGAALSRLLGDEPLRQRMGEAARARSARCTWDRSARATLEALAEEAVLAARLDGYRPARLPARFLA